MNIGDIKKARNRRDFDIALKECTEILKAGDNPDALELRASTYYMKGDGQAAFDDYELLLSWGVDSVGALFMASQSALYIDDYWKAKEWLEKMLVGSERTGNHGFDTAAWLALAFAKIKTNDFQGAEALIEKNRICVTQKYHSQCLMARKCPMSTLPELRAEISRLRIR